MINSKKGALFHWIVFGILAALGVFLFMVQTTDIALTTNGDWQLTFVRHYYLQGEQELIITDQAALQLGRAMIPLLATKAGFVEDSPCGIIDKVQYWNNGAQFCFPPMTSHINSLFSTLSPSFFGAKKEYVLSYEGQELIGKTDEKTTVSVSTTLQDKALQRLLLEEKLCVEQTNRVPLFDSFGKVDSCMGCLATADCSQYHNRFYCDLDPCHLNCVSQYTNDHYISCMECPVDTSCQNYINQYYCEFDPCNYGCSWEFNSCISGITNKWWEQDIHTKITLISFPESLTRATSYTVKPHFRVNIGYDFDEYQQLKEEAAQLLTSCSNEQDLQSCLSHKKKSNWKFKDCTLEEFQSPERKVPFCVLSQYKMSDAQGNLQPVTYSIGLDFTPRTAIGVDDIVVRSGTSGIEVTFAPDSSAEEYTIQYTNWLEAHKNIPGSSSEIFSSLPRAVEFGYFVKSVPLPALEEECLASKDVGKAYSCAGKIVYVFQDASIEAGKTYLLTIISKKEGTESPILQFISFTS